MAKKSGKAKGMRPIKPGLPPKVSQPGVRPPGNVRRAADGGFGFGDDTRWMSTRQESLRNMARPTVAGAGNLSEFGAGGMSASTPAAPAQPSMGPVVTDYSAPGRTYTDAGYSPTGVQSLAGQTDALGNPLGTGRKSSLRYGYADGKSMKNGMHMPGMVEGPGTGTSDSVGPARLPESGERAMLSKGEAVIPADTVDEMNEDFFDGDPQGVEKYVLVNHEPVGSQTDWNRRIKKVGGPDALRQFAAQHGEESPEVPTTAKDGKSAKRCADGLRFYQEGKDVNDLADTAGEVLKPLDSGDTQNAANALRNRDQQIDAITDAATTQVLTPAVTVAAPPSGASTAVDSLHTGVAPSQEQVKASEAALADMARTSQEQAAAQKAAYDKYQAELAAKKAAEEAAKNDSFFSFADGKGLRHYASGKEWTPFPNTNAQAAKTASLAAEEAAANAAYNDALINSAKNPKPIFMDKEPAAKPPPKGLRAVVNTARDAVKRNPIKSTYLAGAGIQGAYEGYNTPTSAYYERLGLDPSTEGLSTLKDLGVRGVGVASDVINAAALGMPERFGMFADKNYTPVGEESPVSPSQPVGLRGAPQAGQKPAGLRGTPQADQMPAGITQTGKNRFEGTGVKDTPYEVASQEERRRVDDARNDNKFRSEEWIRRNPHRYLQNQQIVADAMARETAAAQAQYGAMKDQAAAQERAGDRDMKYHQDFQNLIKDDKDKDAINKVFAMYPQLYSGAPDKDVAAARKIAEFTTKNVKTKGGTALSWEQLPAAQAAQSVDAPSSFFNTGETIGYLPALRDAFDPTYDLNVGPGGSIVRKSNAYDPHVAAILRQYGN